MLSSIFIMLLTYAIVRRVQELQEIVLPDSSVPSTDANGKTFFQFAIFSFKKIYGAFRLLITVISKRLCAVLSPSRGPM